MFMIKRFLSRKKVACLVIISIIIIVLFLAVVLLNKIQEYRKKVDAAEAREQIIVILNEKYGDGDYEIISMDYGIIVPRCGRNSIKGYEFVISTSYLEEDFNISISEQVFAIWHDDFLDKYYYEKQGINDLNEYLIAYKKEKLNGVLSEEFNATIRFDDAWVQDFFLTWNKKYGMVPSIDELAEYVMLNDPTISINDNIETEEELLDYLVNLTKFFVTKISNENISYKYMDEYFEYEYEYDCRQLTNCDEYENLDVFTGKVFLYEPYSEEKDKVNKEVNFMTPRYIHSYDFDEFWEEK